MLHLKNSAILDSGTTIHIFNEISRFLNFQSAEYDMKTLSGQENIRSQSKDTAMSTLN